MGPSLPPATRRVAVLCVLALVAGIAIWRAELFRVWPGEGPRPLATRAPERRAPIDLDVDLPAVAGGSFRLSSSGGPLLIHYWAPWERHARAQAHSLDSLGRHGNLEGLGIAVVCFDPFPSVSRYVARQRLRLAVLLDGPGRLRQALPCPSLPYTYVIDRSGRIAVSQAGEIDWWAPSTRRALEALLAEPAPPTHGKAVSGI